MSSRRLRRANNPKQPGLNLVSLMDIFTILVFFLMVNASEVEILETSTAIKLPDSVSEDEPEDRISIEVSNDELLLQGEVIGYVPDILANDQPTIDVLVAGLTQAALATGEPREGAIESVGTGKVTIMGDKSLPYELLKRVMLSCQTANFRQIALAVNQVAEGEEAS